MALTGYSNEDCCAAWKAYDNINWCSFMDDSILCAGNMNVSIGSCNGDSGGPLTYFNGTHTGDFLKLLISHYKLIHTFGNVLTYAGAS